MQIFFSIRDNAISGVHFMTGSKAQRVADPRQSPFDRAMDGVKTITIAQRDQLIRTAEKRYKATMKKRQAARR